MYLKTADWLVLTGGLLGIIYFALRFSATYPEGALQGIVTSQRAEKIADSVLTSVWFPQQSGLDTLMKFVELDHKRPLAIFLQEKLGLDAAIQTMRNRVPVYSWKVRWTDIKSSDIKISSNKSDGDQPVDRVRRGLEVLIDGRGHLLAYSVQPSMDKTPTGMEEKHAGPAIPHGGPHSADSARISAHLFLQTVANIDTTKLLEKSVQTTSREKQTAYDFVFENKTPIEGIDQTVELQLTNGVVTKYESLFKPPLQFVAPKDRWYQETQDISQIILLIASIVLTAIYFFIRFRRGAFDFKLGLFYGSIAGLCFSAMIGLELIRVSWLGTLLVTVFAGGFYFIVTAIAVSVCASLAREAWPEKYQTFEAIRRGRILNQNTGVGIVRGILWAFITLGLTTFIIRFVPDSSVWLNSQSTGKYDVNGTLFIFAAGLWTSLLAVHCYFLFPLTIARLRTKSTWILYLIGILVALVAPYILDGAAGLPTKLLLSLTLGIIYTTLLVRYDFLTLFTAVLMSYLIQETSYIFLIGNPADLVWLLSAFGAVGVFALLALFSGQTGKDVLEYVPDYVKELETKQRMQREFEIARHIQDSLLCRTTPSLPVFDIASFCDPAYEVGGDYYDFVQFPGRRIGVVIGDVSGKGVSAAFYMTLAKGIVQTQALMTPESTKETLSRVNDVFYQQIDRGKFISMIYAIFDYDRHRMIMSRAGHNPVLIKKSSNASPESLTTNGMAIGLTKGTLFSDELEEVELSLKPGDLYVFYTDGFPEARNNAGNEFGEERLADVIQKNSHLRASDIVQQVRTEIGTFVGDTPQHDDMTMIVVKIQ